MKDSNKPNYYILLTWWFLCLLVPTVVFKYFYIDRIYYGGIVSALGGSIDVEYNFLKQLYALTLFARDYLEVFISVLVVYMIGTLLRVRVQVIAAISIFLGLLIGGINWVSVDQLQTLMTPNNLGITIHWFKDNPRSLLADIGISEVVMGIMFFSLCVILPFVPSYAVRLSNRREKYARLHKIIFLFIVLLGVSSSLFYYAIYERSNGVSRPYLGYWSMLITAFTGSESDDKKPFANKVPTKQELTSKYDDLIFPGGKHSIAIPIIDLPDEVKVKKNIIFVVFETAPKKYYPVIGNPAFPAFHKMSQQAITNDYHYTNTPFTTKANFSIISGTYNRPGKPIERLGDFEADSLASVLSRQGYETTYIDSYKIGWRPTHKHKKMFNSLGFDTLIESADYKLPAGMGQYNKSIKIEEESFRQIAKSILSAKQKGKKAFTYLMTVAGHYEWKASPENKDLSGKDKIHYLTKRLDNMMGRLLIFLSENNLGDDVIIVVTGDHGLRYKKEFDSLNEKMGHNDVAFNVPLMIYAPGIIENQLQLPHITSHVDITPTVLELIGLSSNKYFHHGMSMLDKRIEDRITFMLNMYLSPIDGYHCGSKYITYNHLTEKTFISDNSQKTKLYSNVLSSPLQENPACLKYTPKEILASAYENLRLTSSYLLFRKDPSKFEIQ